MQTYQFESEEEQDEHDHKHYLAVQPFQQCAKREEWDQKFNQLYKLDITQEKIKIEQKRKPPRKPLSPYIFFSQEKRKEIKKIKGNQNLNAKQIMKLVSKKWQEIKDENEETDKYQYLSLRDREAYVILKRYWEEIQKETQQKLFEQAEHSNKLSYQDTEIQDQSIANTVHQSKIHKGEQIQYSQRKDVALIQNDPASQLLEEHENGQICIFSNENKQNLSNIKNFSMPQQQKINDIYQDKNRQPINDFQEQWNHVPQFKEGQSFQKISNKKMRTSNQQSSQKIQEIDQDYKDDSNYEEAHEKNEKKLNKRQKKQISKQEYQQSDKKQKIGLNDLIRKNNLKINLQDYSLPQIILQQFPQTVKNTQISKKYDKIDFNHNRSEYENQNKKVEDILKQVSINFSKRQDDFDLFKNQKNVGSERDFKLIDMNEFQGSIQQEIQNSGQDQSRTPQIDNRSLTSQVQIEREDLLVDHRRNDFVGQDRLDSDYYQPKIQNQQEKVDYFALDQQNNISNQSQESINYKDLTLKNQINEFNKQINEQSKSQNKSNYNNLKIQNDDVNQHQSQQSYKNNNDATIDKLMNQNELKSKELQQNNKNSKEINQMDDNNLQKSSKNGFQQQKRPSPLIIEGIVKIENGRKKEMFSDEDEKKDQNKLPFQNNNQLNQNLNQYVIDQNNCIHMKNLPHNHELLTPLQNIYLPKNNLNFQMQKNVADYTKSDISYYRNQEENQQMTDDYKNKQMQKDVYDIANLRIEESETSKQQLQDYYLKKNDQKIKLDSISNYSDHQQQKGKKDNFKKPKQKQNKHHDDNNQQKSAQKNKNQKSKVKNGQGQQGDVLDQLDSKQLEAQNSKMQTQNIEVLHETFYQNQQQPKLYEHQQNFNSNPYKYNQNEQMEDTVKPNASFNQNYICDTKQHYVDNRDQTIVCPQVQKILKELQFTQEQAQAQQVLLKQQQLVINYLLNIKNYHDQLLSQQNINYSHSNPNFPFENQSDYINQYNNHLLYHQNQNSLICQKDDFQDQKYNYRMDNQGNGMQFNHQQQVQQNLIPRNQQQIYTPTACANPVSFRDINNAYIPKQRQQRFQSQQFQENNFEQLGMMKESINGERDLMSNDQDMIIVVPQKDHIQQDTIKSPYIPNSQNINQNDLFNLQQDYNLLQQVDMNIPIINDEFPKFEKKISVSNCIKPQTEIREGSSFIENKKKRNLKRNQKQYTTTENQQLNLQDNEQDIRKKKVGRPQKQF